MCRSWHRADPSHGDISAAAYLSAMDCITELPAPLQDRLAGRDMIVFDGVCVLCSAFFQFIVNRDRAARFHFATAQSDLGQALFEALDLPTEEFETVLVIVEGRIYQRARGFAATMWALGWPWRLLTPILWVPEWLSDPIYHAIARNRYALFGKTDECYLPTPDIQSRFIT